jgi:UDP:flavonoid glycosyltransferase YjiC (YdhE family)
LLDQPFWRASIDASGVPILGIPLYGANRRNLEKIQAKGLGVIVEKAELNAAKGGLSATINAILGDAKFASRAKELSREFKSRPSTPFEEARSRR